MEQNDFFSKKFFVGLREKKRKKSLFYNLTFRQKLLGEKSPVKWLNGSVAYLAQIWVCVGV